MGSEHYYSQSTATSDERHRIEYFLEDRAFNFFASNAVFSKKRIDFGSDLLIKTFLKYIRSNNLSNQDIKIIDMGCGYGVISLVLAEFCKNLKSIMLDINSRAIELSLLNINLLGLDNRLEAYSSDLYKVLDSSLIQESRIINSSKNIDKFDFILTNPPIRTGKDNVFKIYSQGIKYLKDSGSIFVVIQKKQGASSSIKELESLFGNVEKLKTKAGYWILRAWRG